MACLSFFSFFRAAGRRGLLLLCSAALLLSAQAAQAAGILVYGDSLSAGYGLKAGQEWPALLQQRLQKEGLGHITVHNRSLSGETTGGGLARLPQALQQHRPDVVVLELGANDGLRGQNLAQMQSNLQRMVALSRQAGAQVLLVGIQIPPNYGKRYTQSFQRSYTQLAQQEGLPLVPFMLEGVAGQDALMQKDALHANAAAQPIILANIWPHLQPLLKAKVAARPKERK